MTHPALEGLAPVDGEEEDHILALGKGRRECLHVLDLGDPSVL